MIRFWISLVPSKIVVSRASRQCRSTWRSVTRRVPWFAVAAAFCVAEILIVTIRFRGQTSSFPLCDLLIVPALFFVAPAQLVPAVLLGGAVSFLFRRVERIKAVFNLAQWALEITLSAALFHLLRPAVPDPATPQ